jgi:hypothetical protein
VSQNVASLPAQSAGELQLLPWPSGGRRQKLGDVLVTQAYPAAHSLELVQPTLVQ